MRADKLIPIKGTRDGLLITLGEGDWELLLEQLDQRLTSTATFFRGGRVTLHIGNRPMTEDTLQEVADLLEIHGITLVRVISEDPVTRRLARKLGFASTPPRVHPSTILGEVDNGLVIRRTLRSGQSVRHPGPVIIIGDVNPGAEVVAGGDVIVWGHLRGLVHAGALGDEKAIVCALHLAPTQLRIGSHIARPPDEEDGEGNAEHRTKAWYSQGAPRDVRPEIARVEGGRIVVDAWQ